MASIRFSILFLIIMLCFPFTAPMAQSKDETAYARIQRTDTIRCGYLVAGNFFKRDPATGEMSGIFHDIMEQIGQNAGLKIEWTEETGYETIFSALDAKRFDVFAAGLWASPEREAVGDFSAPAFNSIVTAWVRADETRFQNLEGINNPSVRISAIDGAMESIIARTDFPKATVVSMPQLTPFGMNYQNIVDRKADITFAEPSMAYDFMDAHPGSLKQIAPDKPLRTFGTSLAIRKGEKDLKDFLDSAMQKLIADGQIEKIIEKYETRKDIFLLIEKPPESRTDL